MGSGVVLRAVIFYIIYSHSVLRPTTMSKYTRPK